jgi:hypothetical protein
VTGVRTSECPYCGKEGDPFSKASVGLAFRIQGAEPFQISLAHRTRWESVKQKLVEIDKL